MWQIHQISLRYFIAVCEEGTIARAAERECIAVSAISKRLADLEAVIDAALLARSQRVVRPTAAGEALLKHARLILRSHEHLQAESSEYSTGARGYVRVLANVSFMVEFLPEALFGFLKENPAVRVDVEERVSAEIVRGVEEGFAELGICHHGIPTGELEVWPYLSDHLALVVPKNHPLAANTSISFEETLDLDHLGLSSNASVNAFTQRVAQEMGRELYCRMNVSTFDAAYRFIQAGLAVAIIPCEAVSLRMREEHGLAVIPLEEAWAQRRFVLCVRDRAGLTLPAARLAEHLMAGRARSNAGSNQM